jgi:hypothetical protein
MRLDGQGLDKHVEHAPRPDAPGCAGHRSKSRARTPRFSSAAAQEDALATRMKVVIAALLNYVTRSRCHSGEERG